MMEGWKKIYSAKEEYQAQVVKSLLSRSSLNPVIMDRKDDEFGIGYAEVYVAPEEADKALQIIKDNDNKESTG